MNHEPLESERLAELVERRNMIDTAIGQMYEVKNLVVDEILAERNRLHTERQHAKAAAHYAALVEQVHAERDAS